MQCSLSCGGRGVKTRTVQCVWVSNMQPTSVEHCAVLPKPPDSRPCYTSPCVDSGKLLYVATLLRAVRIATRPSVRTSVCPLYTGLTPDRKVFSLFVSVITRGSAMAEEPRDALRQLKYYDRF